MSSAQTADATTPIRASTRNPSTGRTTLVVAQLFTALLLLFVGIWLIVLFQLGFNGGGILVAFGAVEIVLGVASIAAIPGLRAGRRPGWVLPNSIAGAIFNALVILFAAATTITVLYPGGPVVLLILFNDVVIGELVVSYFLTRSAD